jgi:hypothetical protein
VGVPDGTGSAFVRVRVELSSGASMIFDVSEEIFDGLELLRDRGLAGTKLCEAWLGAAAPREAPILMHVFGVRANGTPIDVRVHCTADHPASPR